MSTYTQILYQIIFGTKHHKPVMSKTTRSRLFGYMIRSLESKKCHPYQINGVENHLHILTHLHPSVALADLVKDLKLASSKFIKENRLFKEFEGWQDGYSAFTYSKDSQQNLINYIKNQEEHHRHKTFREELIEILKEHGVPFDEKYLL